MFLFAVYGLIMILVIVGITLIVNHYHDKPLYLERLAMYKKGYINLGSYSKPRWADRAKCHTTLRQNENMAQASDGTVYAKKNGTLHKLNHKSGTKAEQKQAKWLRRMRREGTTEGYLAFYSLKKYDDNPYPVGDIKKQFWYDGFNQASREDKQNEKSSQ